MRYRLVLNAWDIMDRVQVRVQMWEDNDTPEPSTARVVELSRTVQGVGESDPWQWARDALVAALEEL